MTDPSRSRSGAVVDGRYLLVDPLGLGNFGEVWKALDQKLGNRAVALKLLRAEHADSAEIVARFEQEADAMATLSHPNVVALLGRGRFEEQPYIVMEFVEGRSVDRRIEAYRVLERMPELSEVRDIFDQICAGVAAAHAVADPGPIVHRDVKPANVMVRRAPKGGWSVKVLDFGIAQLGARNRTLTGVRMGTIGYMAPEQALGEARRVGPWTDVFSLAVTLVEMLTLHAGADGEQPWWGAVLSRGTEVHSLLTSRRDDVPPAVWDVLMAALSAEPTKRPANAAALRAGLDQAWRRHSLDATMLSTEGVMPLVAMKTSSIPPRPVTRPPSDPSSTVAESGWQGETLPVGMVKGTERGSYVWKGPRDLDLDMVYLAPGRFWMGDNVKSEVARHRRVIERGYFLARHPTTVEEFARFARETRYQTEAERAGRSETWRAPGFAQEAKHPVVCVSWNDARAYCDWVGLRLPTEAEWEYAARGTDGRRHPWGDEEPTNERMWWSGQIPREGTTRVGQHPAGASPGGIQDMVGNVRQWTSDHPAATAGAGTRLPASRSTVDELLRVNRGASWSFRDPWSGTIGIRFSEIQTTAKPTLGFRCARGM